MRAKLGVGGTNGHFLRSFFRPSLTQVTGQNATYAAAFSGALKEDGGGEGEKPLPNPRCIKSRSPAFKLTDLTASQETYLRVNMLM